MAKKILALILILVLVVPFAVACNKEEEPTQGTTTQSQTTKKATSTTPKKEEEETPVLDEVFKDGKLAINGKDISEYVIVVPAKPENSDNQFASGLASWIKAVTGQEIAIVNDSTAPAANEIIVGNTSRAQSAEISDTFEGTRDYKAILNDGKIAVKFNLGLGSVSALNAMQRSFANNGCNITEGFTNRSIELEEVKGLVMGAIRTEITDLGFQVYRSTQAQVDAWHEYTKEGYNDWTYENARSATGIRLDFETDSSYVYLKLSKPASALTVLLNGELAKNGWWGGYWNVPKEERGKTNRITILMSNVRNTHQWGIEKLEIDGGCKIEKHKTDLNILFLGDSITEAFSNAGRPAANYTFYTYSYFNADAIVQGYGSSQLWTDMIDPAMAELYQPDVIIVAMGTNDYSRNRSGSVDYFKERMDAFLDKIQQVYPGVQIIGITPLRRLLSMTASNAENNYDKECVARASAGYAQSYKNHGAIVVQGESLLKDVKHYADTVHPNEAGHLIYGENLCAVIKNDIEDIIKNKNK